MEIDFIKALKHALTLPLPGMEVQFEMAHVNREKLKPGDLNNVNFRKSAVLILICKNKNGFFIPLTERHEYKGAHSGQVSLPGGKFEEEDLCLENTALRECFEEIGIKDEIEILGELSPVYIPVSKFLVHPFIGYYKREENIFSINTNEVKNLIELSLSELMDPDLVKQTTVEPLPGLKLKTPYFDIQGKIVWGATAMILNEFKYLLKPEAIASLKFR